MGDSPGSLPHGGVTHVREMAARVYSTGLFHISGGGWRTGEAPLLAHACGHGVSSQQVLETFLLGSVCLTSAKIALRPARLSPAVGGWREAGRREGPRTRSAAWCPKVTSVPGSG